MKSGKLDRRITIQVRTVVTDALGGETETWADEFPVWAERETQSATERFVTVQKVADVNTLFRIRWVENIANDVGPKTHRLTYRGRVYEILAVVEIGRREGMWIGCASRADTGGTP